MMLPHGQTRFESEGLSLLQNDKGVALLLLHSPPANEIGLKMLSDFEKLLSQLGENPPRALVIASKDLKSFSAGADLRELHLEIEAHYAKKRPILRLQTSLLKQEDKLPNWTRTLPKKALHQAEKLENKLLQQLAEQRIEKSIRRLHAVMDRLDMLPFTTIAAIEGVCMGGGFELALTCDLRVASQSARFAFPELRLGLVPGWGGTARLAREVGQGILRDLLLTGRSMGASRAYALGLIQQPVKRGQALDIAIKMAERSTQFEAHVIEATKALTKALPEEALQREIETFTRLFPHPAVRKALKRFYHSTNLRPYL